MKDKIVKQVIKKFKKRSKLGVEKYKTTLEHSTQGEDEFLNHLQEELMDAILYIEKLKTFSGVKDGEQKLMLASELFDKQHNHEWRLT